MRSERSPLPISDLRVAASFACLLAHLLVLDARRQHRQRLRLVLVLRAVVLAFDHDAGRQVRDAHGRIGLVDVLAAGARGAESVDAHLGRIDHHVVDLVGLRHHRHGAGRGVDAALGLGLRHALHAVAAGFELEFRVGALADDPGDDLLVAADLRALCEMISTCQRLRSAIARIHAEQVAGEQRRFVAAGAGADFEEDVALVVGVLGQQLLLQFGLEPAGADRVSLRSRLSANSRISGSASCPAPSRDRPVRACRLVQLDHRLDLGMLARQLAVVVHVGRGVFGREQAIELLQPREVARASTQCWASFLARDRVQAVEQRREPLPLVAVGTLFSACVGACRNLLVEAMRERFQHRARSSPRASASRPLHFVAPRSLGMVAQRADRRHRSRASPASA